MKEDIRLPDFIGIGAMKSGTTSLYHYLTQHPYIIPAKKKEIDFFDLNFHKGLSWYKSQFPLLSNHKKKGITGEASPYYMFHPHAPRRIQEVMPDAKLIVILRNPVDRAYSHYNFVKKVKVPFEKAIQMEKNRINKEKLKMLKDETYNSPFYRQYSLLSRGIYVDQLKAFSHYFDKKQILVLRSEDLFENPGDVMNQAYEFLGLPHHEIKKFKVFKGRKYPPLDSSVKRELTEYFKPHNKRLYDFLGKDLKWK